MQNFIVFFGYLSLEFEMENEIVIYQPNNTIHLEVRMADESVWLNRNQMSVLFGRDVKTIGKHINNALHEELRDMATVANFATVQNEGGRQVTRFVEFYNAYCSASARYSAARQPVYADTDSCFYTFPRPFSVY